ncbi:heavy metal sensor histidine kinase [Geomonas sp. RF6]|uniref:heavy metal sensor histidine kinase n=1 Tax=Geomonas sp. RF6 TaxID=2897342 RepID=UPI001E31B013|nr:heavy metal sensor histidine kinase [Geomonas sp. RF6]UFS71034.1 heavy metal sensor histidine kinase [Geomonas sp. RF6]
MSLKSAEKDQPRPWSLTLWLTLFNTAFSFGILTLISVLLYQGLAFQLRQQNSLYLHDLVDTIRRELVELGSEVPTLKDEVVKEHSGAEYVKHYVRLFDMDGRLLVESPRMEEILPRNLYPLPVRDGRSPDHKHRTRDGRLLVSTMAWMPLGKNVGEQGVLQAALDVSNVEQILVEYRRKIMLALAHGFVLCAGGSLLIARRGTRPIREITTMVRGITVAGLEEHLHGDNWPRELQQLAEALNLMMDRLHDSFTRLYNSATNLTHKMRTPLTILRGEAEVALSRARTVEELQEVIISSLEENARLSRLGDNIFFLANADMRKFSVSRSVVQVREEMEKILDYYSPLAEEKEVSIVCNGDATFMVDPSLLRKAAAAVTSNAVTYNKPGGKVEITIVQREPLGGEISFSDTGCGIALGEMQKIFDRFYRIYGTRHMDPHGTGLGLPIAKAIMDLHDGSISLESGPDLGTTVTLTFPPPPQGAA